MTDKCKFLQYSDLTFWSYETEIAFESDTKQIFKAIDSLLQKKQNTFVNDFNFIKLRKIRPFRILKKPSENSIITCKKASNTWDLDFDGYATHRFLISCVSDAATQLFTKCGVNHKWRADYQIGSAALDYIVRYYILLYTVNIYIYIWFYIVWCGGGGVVVSIDRHAGKKLPT